MARHRLKQHTEIAGDEICPCETGKSYKSCCKKRRTRWMRDSRGSLYREVPVNAEVVEALKSAAEDFKTVFGRRPRRTDPVFLSKYSVSTTDSQREVLRALKLAKIRPEIVYAYLKTDRLVTDPGKLTTKQMSEYSDAIEEFRRLLNEGVPAEELIDPQTPEKILSEALQQLQIICGYFIEKYINSNRIKRNQEVEFVVGFAFVNFVKSLRSIIILLENDISYDANYLVRSLYENYIKIHYIYKYPLKIGVFLDEFYDLLSSQSAPPNGSNTKKKRSSPPKWGNMADELNERDLYEDLYRPLCAITHSQISEAQFFIKDGLFDYLDLNFELSTLLSTLDLSMRALRCLLQYSPCQKYLKVDLFTALRKTFVALHFTRSYLTKLSRFTVPLTAKSFIANLAIEYPELRNILNIKIDVLSDIPVTV